MKINLQINNIYRTYVDESNISIFSVDETFLDVTDSLKYFGCKSAMELARLIQIKVYEDTGIYTTIGIGDNPLLAKLALDNEAKNNSNMKAEWRYEDVPNKIWPIKDLTDICGIGNKTAAKLNSLGIFSMKHLAEYDYYKIKKEMGVIGAQLYAHAWGIDRSFLGEQYTPKSKSIGNSQVLIRDYTNKEEIEIIIREMADQVATRVRRTKVKTGCIGLYVGYSINFFDENGKSGFSKQMKISPTSSSKRISEYLINIFEQNYTNQVVRHIRVSCSQLVSPKLQQLNLFEEPNTEEELNKFDRVVDDIRTKFGFTKLVYASSLMEGGRAIARSSLIGGHAGGLGGIEDNNDKM